MTSGTVTLTKDGQNLIGISIGGGAPYCPCVYVVQIFDNTPASKDGTLAAGDELVSVNFHPRLMPPISALYVFMKLFFYFVYTLAFYFKVNTH